jgi:uncharacterized protein YdaT
MPWSAQSFKSKHNKKLSPAQSAKAATIANSVLKKTGKEDSAIRIANASVRNAASRRLTKRKY